MTNKSMAGRVAVLVFMTAFAAAALADTVPLTFDCNVFARIIQTEYPHSQWEQDGVNVASVNEAGATASIEFLSGTSAGTLTAFTTSSLTKQVSVGTVVPSHLIIGTTAAAPAGTPIQLSIEAHAGDGSYWWNGGMNLDVARGGTTLANVGWSNPPALGSSTAVVIAGETLDVVFSQWGGGATTNATFIGTVVPEPGALFLVVLGVLTLRRR